MTMPGSALNRLAPDLQVNRVAPKLPVTAVRSFEIHSPQETHTRKASCKEVECQHHLAGWTSTVDVDTELGAMQANYIRLHSGRTFTYVQNGSLVTFTFPAGQICFTEHRVSLERPEIFVVRDGDWRGNPTGYRRQHKQPHLWVEEFADNQDKLKSAQDRG